MTAQEKIAEILRADKDVILKIEKKFEKITGKTGVFESIVKQNDEAMEQRLAVLNLSKKSSAKSIFNGLINKIESDNKKLMEIMNEPNFTCKQGCEIVARFVSSVAGDRNGFFLKKEKFIELIKETPPEKILQMLGYSSVEELVQKEDWKEIAAALRFIQGGEWINDVFLPKYNKLTTDDFEKRDFEIIALGPKWEKLGRKFVEKKYHNISHLKELGIIFIIPVSLNLPGELVRTVGLLFHYINEIKFYSEIFIKISENKNDFIKNIQSLLRGDVPDDKNILLSENWLIVQRYLAKDDENDWRLFSPHLNPEAAHWEKAEKMFVDLGKKYDSLEKDFSFWKNLNWVGDYFSTDTGVDVLVSFNLIDTSMALVKEKEMIKYLYHHQEALWNKIFYSYFGEEKTEAIVKENVLKGYVEISENLIK